MSDLISNGSWDLDTTAGLFWEVDKDAILGIPLSAQGRIDMWLWHFERHGLYSVHSGYKKIMGSLLEASSSVNSFGQFMEEEALETPSA